MSTALADKADFSISTVSLPATATDEQTVAGEHMAGPLPRRRHVVVARVSSGTSRAHLVMSRSTRAHSTPTHRASISPKAAEDGCV